MCNINVKYFIYLITETSTMSFVLYKLWRLLWSIYTVHLHAKMKFIYIYLNLKSNAYACIEHFIRMTFYHHTPQNVFLFMLVNFLCHFFVNIIIAISSQFSKFSFIHQM